MSDTQRICALEARVRRISRALGFKQIKYSDGALTGAVDCCYIFGIDFTTGNLYYKDSTGNWALATSGGGGGATARFGIEDNLGVQFREMDMDGFIFNLINAESIQLLSNAGDNFSGITCQGTTNASTIISSGNLTEQASIEVDVNTMLFTTPDGVQTLARGGGYTVLSVNGQVADQFGAISITPGVPVVGTIDITGLTEIDLSSFPTSNIIILTSSNPTETIDTIVGVSPDLEIRLEPAAGLTVTFNRTTASNDTPNADEIVIPTDNYIANGDFTDWFTIQKEQSWIRQMDGMTYELIPPDSTGTVLTNGNGTTANGSAADLGGTVTANINLSPDTLNTYNFQASDFNNVDITGATEVTMQGGRLNLGSDPGFVHIDGIDSQGSPTNLLWIDGSGFVHSAPVASISVGTFQSVTDAGKTTTNSISVGTSSAPTSKLDIVNTSLGGAPATLTGLLLKNATIATISSIAQSSPPIEFRGNAWDAFNGVNYPTKFAITNIAASFGVSPSPGPGSAGTPVSYLYFQSNDTGSTKTPLILSSQGDVTCGNGITFNGTRQVTANGEISYFANTGGTTQHRFANPTNALTSGSAVVRIESGGSTAASYAKSLEVIGDINTAIFSAFSLGNAAIGPDTAPSKLAQLDINSLGRGLLMPRMTTTQRDGIPKGIVSIAVTGGGSGYLTAPGVTIPAPIGGGLQARAHAVVSGGTVTSVVVDFRGSNYPTAPSITFNNTGTGFPGPDGSGAAATATVDVLTIPLGLMIFNTDSDSGNGAPQYYNGASVWKTLIGT